jgi:membrane peptidoglycan carboxypeptidase
VPKLAAVKKAKGGTSYFLMDTVRRELKANGFSDREIDLGGLRVVTTFNRKAQRAAVQAVKQERPTEHARNVHIGLSAVTPGTGAVVAMYGGDTAGGLNEVTQARVQPGSAFKPFALAGALRDGISLKSRFHGNSPLDLPGTNKQVNNEFDKSYGSSVDLVKATAESINTAFVDLTLHMGASKVVKAATDAGIPADTPGLTANAVTTLGTSSVRNIDMADAYATFAAGGQAATWYTVSEVKGSNGGVRYRARPQANRVFDKDVVSDVDYALQQVVKTGSGTEARALGRPAAGKTGTAALRPGTTTSAWFVGYTPQLSAAVDFYKGTGKADLDGVGGLSTFFGGDYPARVWTAFMTAAMQNLPVKDFPPPANVGQAVNPKPTFTPSPTTSTPTSTPTTSAPTILPTTPIPTTSLPGPPSTPPGQSSPPATITLSPGTG